MKHAVIIAKTEAICTSCLEFSHLLCFSLSLNVAIVAAVLPEIVGWMISFTNKNVSRKTCVA